MKCKICGKEILRDSQCINYKYYHNDCIENLQQENKQLKEDIKNIIKILNKNCKDLEATEEEFDSLDRWENEK